MRRSATTCHGAPVTRVRLLDLKAASVWLLHVSLWWRRKARDALLGTRIHEERKNVGCHRKGNPDAVRRQFSKRAGAHTAAAL
jgi:hypothetical protein